MTDPQPLWRIAAMIKTADRAYQRALDQQCDPDADYADGLREGLRWVLGRETSPAIARLLAYIPTPEPEQASPTSANARQASALHTSPPRPAQGSFVLTDAQQRAHLEDLPTTLPTTDAPTEETHQRLAREGLHNGGNHSRCTHP